MRMCCKDTGLQMARGKTPYSQCYIGGKGVSCKFRANFFRFAASLFYQSVNQATVTMGNNALIIKRDENA